MPRVVELGHIGLYVRDVEQMERFYRDFLGMQVTKRSPGRGLVFLSPNPTENDHQIALVKGRPADDNPHLINQISMRVETLADLREFHRKVKQAGYPIERVVNHGSAIGCYFQDPEGNTTEVFWRTGQDNWVPTSEPVDLETTSDDEILAHVQRIIDREGDVPMGQVREAAKA